ncbi:MAG: SAM-dependent methyltransferase [Acidobacteria bacterium]|nr:SAM-dependent methyltransferase [Acidobacteriota bacterium]
MKRSLLVPHVEETREPDPEGRVYRTLVPEQISHISYPYEWSFAQLKDAALLTLEVQKTALQHGMSLKDASGFNVVFRGPRPVFIDTLSFEKNTGKAWVAYGQFGNHFLAPLLLMAEVSLELNGLLRSHLDGIPLELASKLLPRQTWMRLGPLMHVHLHARSQKKYAPTGGAEARPKAALESGPDRKAAIVDSLISTVEGVRLPGAKTEWIDYYKELKHYSREAEDFKQSAVRRVVESLRPRLVYDLGGNVGTYSRLVTQQGIDCVCYDIDPLCVNQNYLESKRNGDSHMLPLLMDLTNPTPPLGFGLNERLGFLDRSRPDLTLALALMHHIRITGNVPLARMAEVLARMTRHLLIEWVPKEDRMAQSIMGNRPDIFEDYTLANFQSVFGDYFSQEKAEEIPGTGRTLYLFCNRV